jgi:hypothetical protein
MLNAMYFILALVATGIAVYFTWFYEVSIPGTEYNYTFAIFALTAAIIFTGLWLAGIIHKSTSKSRILFD